MLRFPKISSNYTGVESPSNLEILMQDLSAEELKIAGGSHGHGRYEDDDRERYDDDYRNKKKNPYYYYY